MTTRQNPPFRADHVGSFLRPTGPAVPPSPQAGLPPQHRLHPAASERGQTSFRFRRHRMRVFARQVIGLAAVAVSLPGLAQELTLKFQHIWNPQASSPL